MPSSSLYGACFQTQSSSILLSVRQLRIYHNALAMAEERPEEESFVAWRVYVYSSVGWLISSSVSDCIMARTNLSLLACLILASSSTPRR